MFPAKHTMKVYERDSIDYPIWYLAGGVLVDFTGYEAEMIVRKQKGSATELLTLSTADGSILLGADVISTVEYGGETANLQLYLLAPDLDDGEYVYDLSVTVAGKKTTLLYGPYLCIGEI